MHLPIQHLPLRRKRLWLFVLNIGYLLFIIPYKLLKNQTPVRYSAKISFLAHEVLSNFQRKVYVCQFSEKNLERKRECTCLSSCSYLSHLLCQSLWKTNILSLKKKGILMVILFQFQPLSHLKTMSCFGCSGNLNENYVHWILTCCHPK